MKPVKLGAVVFVAAIVATIAMVMGRRTVDEPRPAAARTPATTAAPSDFTEFRDEKSGWAISYPRAWSHLQTNDSDVLLVASEKSPAENNGGSILARVLPLGAPVGPDQLAEARQVTDRIVTSGEGVRLLAQPATINQGGLAGYFYFYSFKDSVTQQEGAHSHYFLFKGQTMISFVFQAIPKADFPRLAQTFDQVIGSFRVLSNDERGN